MNALNDVISAGMDAWRKSDQAAGPEDYIEIELRRALGDGHYVTFTEDRWTVEHSIDCRLSGRMHECETHARIAAWVETDSFDFFPDDDDLLGRWRVLAFNDQGAPMLDPAASPTQTPGDAT